MITENQNEENEDQAYPYPFGLNFNDIIFRRTDGAKVSEEDKVASTMNFRMWFGEDIINEVNQREIKVLIIKDGSNNNKIHFLTEDEDLVIRAFTKFYQFPY